MVRYMACGYRDFKKHPVPVGERFNWEVYVVVEGQMAPVFPDGRKVALENEYVWVIPPGLSYGWRSGKEIPNRYVLHFTSVPDAFRQAIGEGRYFGRKLLPKEIGEIDKIYRQLEEHSLAFAPLSTLMVEREKIALSLLLLNGVKLAGKIPLDKIDEQRVETVMAWYQEHMSECPTIDAAAAIVHLSSGHLRRTFHRVRKCGPHEAFTELRLSQAKELLSETSQDLLQVAQQCGFRSDSDFCRVFSKHTGISPHKWRTHITRQDARPELSDAWAEDPPVNREM